MMSAQDEMPLGTAEKFDADGRVKPFAGNTFVSAIDEDCDLSRALADAASRLSATPLGPRLTFLPRSSYHMTVFEGICLDHRDAARWPAGLAAEASLDEANVYFEERIAGVEGIAAPLRLRIEGIESRGAGVVVALEPVSDAENQRLRALQDRLSAATDLSKPGHDTYRFHISLAYWLSRPADAIWEAETAEISATLRGEHRVIELPAPDFCHFADMHAFVPRLSLDKRGG